MSRWLVALVVAGGLSGSATSAADTTERARGRAVELTAAGDHRGAADLLMRAYRANPRPSTLFRWAESERLDGNCKLASRLYSRYVAKHPRHRHAEAAEVGLARCADEAMEAVMEDEYDASVETDVLVEPPPTPPRTRRSITLGATDRATKPPLDKLGTILVVAGLTTAALGAGYYMSADDELGDAAENATHDIVTARTRAADRRRIVGVVTVGVGATAAAAGVLHIVTRRRQARRGVAVQPYATGDGAGVVLRAQF